MVGRSIGCGEETMSALLSSLATSEAVGFEKRLGFDAGRKLWTPTSTFVRTAGVSSVLTSFRLTCRLTCRSAWVLKSRVFFVCGSQLRGGFAPLYGFGPLRKVCTATAVVSSVVGRVGDLSAGAIVVQLGTTVRDDKAIEFGMVWVERAVSCAGRPSYRSSVALCRRAIDFVDLR